MKHFKKFLCILIFSSSFPSLFANIWALNTFNFPQNDEKFNELFEIFYDDVPAVEFWSPEWNFEKTKDEVSKDLSAFYDFLLSYENRNYDIDLLQLITMRFLYNVDSCDYEDIFQHYKYLKEVYPNRWETNWIFGIYLSQTSLLHEAYFQMDEIFTYFGRDFNNIENPYFLNDFTTVSIAAGMYIHANAAFNRLKAVTGTVDSDYSFFSKSLNSNLLRANMKKTYTSSKIWTNTTYNGKYSIYNTLFGFRYDGKPGETISVYDMTNANTAIKFMSEPMSIPGMNITSNIAILFRTDGITATKENVIKLSSNGGEVIKDGKINLKGISAEYLMIKNDEMYNDEREGSICMYIYFDLPYSPSSGLNIESPIIMETEDTGELSFFSHKNVYKRAERTVSVIICIDTCNAVREQAFKWAGEVLKNCIFE